MYPDQNDYALFIKRQNKSKAMFPQHFVGTVNNCRWFFGWRPRQWMLEGLTITRRPLWWETKYRFRFKRQGWQPLIETDKDIKEFEIYKSVDFDVLGLTERDWVNPEIKVSSLRKIIKFFYRNKKKG